MKETNKYLVVNPGSSSLKFSLYEMPERKEVANCYIQKVGLEDSFYTLKINGKKQTKEVLVKNHIDATNLMVNILLENSLVNDIKEIEGIGYRVLHGGEIYSKSIIIEENDMKNIRDLIKLGPLHQPAQIIGIESMKLISPDTPIVAVFDTAFHQTMPEESYIYPVNYEWYEKHGVRKYGFHGTSYNYITNKMKTVLNNEKPNLIICHIGSGASIAAIKEGNSLNTSMGLTPLDGLMMGTRSGSIDPSIIEYMVNEGKSIEETMDILNKKSGLVGICGKSDTRDIEKMVKENDKQAILALKLYTNSIINYIAQYYFQLEGKLDGIVFTAGVGENSAIVRKMVVNKIGKIMNIKLDNELNKLNNSVITSKDSFGIPVFVIPTNEELMILNDTYDLVQKSKKQKEQEKHLKKTL